MDKGRFSLRIRLSQLERIDRNLDLHDLGHIAQISRVMGKQYNNEIGPWIKYLKVVNKYGGKARSF